MERFIRKHRAQPHLIRVLVLCTLALAVPASVGAFSLPVLPVPYLLYSVSEPESNANGVTPDSGASGTAFTFSVSYISPGSSPGTAPSTSNLLIDLNGDGIVGGIVTPFYRPPEVPWPALMLVALGLLLLLLARRAARRRPVLAHAGVALAAVFLVLGCNGSDSDGSAFASHGGLALASCSSPAGESIPMTDPGGDYTTGVDFVVTVPLTCEPGIVLFKFDFVVAGVLPADLGTAVNLHTLQITP